MSDPRELMSALQAPIADEFLSWKPGNTFESNGQWFAVYFPYVNKEFLEERLDEVLGLEGWNADYSEDNKGITHCMLSLFLPGERVSKREGVGSHSTFTKVDEEKTDKQEVDELHGGRTRAFRDACRLFGICGRDIINTQTRPVKISGKVKDGKIRYFEATEPLSRTLLIHSGASTFKGPQSHRGTVAVGLTPSASTRSPEAHAKASEEAKDIKQEDAEAIVWPFGKHKGQVLAALPSHYLTWVLDNVKQLNPESNEFNAFLHGAVCIQLDKKAKEKAEAQAKEPANIVAQEPDLESLFEGAEVG